MIAIIYMVKNHLPCFRDYAKLLCSQANFNLRFHLYLEKLLYEEHHEALDLCCQI